MTESGGKGGSTEHPFTWKQTLEELTVTVPVPEGTRGKMLDVSIGKTHLKASLKFKNELLIDDDLFAEVVVDECTWSIIDQKELAITLEKVNKQQWWPHVLVSDEKIDVTKIEPEKSNLQDLDSETRAMVEKMMHDQRNRQEGQPSLEEQERSKVLDEFKKQNPHLDFSNVENDLSKLE